MGAEPDVPCREAEEKGSAELLDLNVGVQMLLDQRLDPVSEKPLGERPAEGVEESHTGNKRAGGPA